MVAPQIVNALAKSITVEKELQKHTNQYFNVILKPLLTYRINISL